MRVDARGPELINGPREVRERTDRRARRDTAMAGLPITRCPEFGTIEV
jgi:hypothetical protein